MRACVLSDTVVVVLFLLSLVVVCVRARAFASRGRCENKLAGDDATSVGRMGKQFFAYFDTV